MQSFSTAVEKIAEIFFVLVKKKMRGRPGSKFSKTSSQRTTARTMVTFGYTYRRLGLSSACASWDNSKNICTT